MYDRAYTWRLANVHWGEGTSDHWYVSGMYYEFFPDGRAEYIGDEQVDDCSIYEGWWEIKKDEEPEPKPDYRL